MNLVWFIVAAGIGGFIRAAVEYYLPPVGVNAFPRATLFVNMVGSFLLGVALALPGELYIILGSGLCGALTTFSGVSLQLQRRLSAQAYRPALGYISILLIAGLAAAGAGLILGETFIR